MARSTRIFVVAPSAQFGSTRIGKKLNGKMMDKKIGLMRRKPTGRLMDGMKMPGAMSHGATGMMDGGLSHQL
jgi:hypothetical protein